ncbi:DnaJ domain-containing protein, partial [Leptodontidium sp. 2 PMI_412]
MAPAPITEDYYVVLEVQQTAAPELIVRSYRRLALKLHPDRNAKHDATEAFQLLGRAYSTLKDESKRRDYDLIYPSITRSRPSPQTTQTPRPPPASTPQSEALSEAAQIAALQKSKQERGARWWTKRNAFNSSILELQRNIRRLEQEIKNLDSIIAAEAAREAQKNSWGNWLLSPIYKKAEDSEEEKARKDRERQERKIEKDMKERRLWLKKADLKEEESLLRKAKEEVDAADLVEDGKIRVIQDRIRARETWERQERERVERERIAKSWKQQQEQREKREREAAEAFRKQQAEERAAAQERQEEHARKWQKILADEAQKRREQDAHFNRPEYLFTAEGSTRQASTSTCQHNGWWSKVQGRTACPECNDIWTYLLQCPGCSMKACPKCQGAIRRR